MLKKVLILIFLPVLFVLVSCGDSGRNRLEREDLFSIPLGKLADEIDFFQRDSLRFSRDNGMVMMHGFFYVTNGRSGKFLKFNSYGDLLSLIYNPDRNPYPAELMSRQTENAEVNRQVIPWQFNSPGNLAVTEETIYIVDKVAPNRQIKDRDVLMDRSILQFNSEGEYINFIGMEGVGGQPFPFIENIWVNSKEELIVLYRTRNEDEESWFVNWYTASGSLRYSVEIRESAIPMPTGEDELSFSVDNIIPHLERYEVSLKMTYFRSSESGISEVFGGTLDFSVEDNEWRDWSRLPENKISTDGLEIDSPYSLIGTAGEYQFFISLNSSNSYNLLIRDGNGRFKEEQLLEVERGDILHTDFHLSREGILSAIVFRDDLAGISWWRTDKLLGLGEQDG